MRKVFATDLDNTLIYSYKHRLKSDVCVETRLGKEQGFMSKSVYDTLPYLSKYFDIIPITTRSIEQFERITLPESVVKRAMVANGAVEYDMTTKSTKKTRDQTEQYETELNRVYQILLEDSDVRITRYVDGAYVYASFESDQIARDVADHIASVIPAIVSHRKLYYIPPYYSKQSAIKSLRDNYDYIICAGDSELDICMLNEADLAIVPRSLASQIKTSVLICPDHMRLSDYVAICLLNMAEVSVGDNYEQNQTEITK